MAGLRVEEKVASATIEATLALAVKQHDDGSRPGMHDLNILTADGTSATVEVTAAADADSIQLWKLVHDRRERWIVPGLRDAWSVRLAPTARAKRLLKELPVFLEKLQDQGITEIPCQVWQQKSSDPLSARARALGIVSGNQAPTRFPGSIYLTIEQTQDRTGGAVDDTGGAVPVWVREFLLDSSQSDVLSKLERSGASHRHAFILVPVFSSAPFGVVDMLWREQGDVVPTVAPELPDQVTHVWLMTFLHKGSGLRWSQDGGWQRFERLFVLDGWLTARQSRSIIGAQKTCGTPCKCGLIGDPD